MKEILTVVYHLLNLSVSELRVLSRVQNNQLKRSVSIKESAPLVKQRVRKIVILYLCPELRNFTVTLNLKTIYIYIYIYIIGIQPLGQFGQRPELSQATGTLHPGQVLRGGLPLFSPAF